MPITPVSQNSVAIIWVVLGTAVFSVVYASGKFAGDGASPLQIVWLRYIGGFLTLACIVVFTRKGVRTYTSKRPVSHLFRAIFGCYGGAAIIYSSANMPIVDATAISLLYVGFVIPLGVIFLGERIRRTQWAAIVLSNLGAATIMMSRGAFQGFDTSYLWPAFIALAGAMLVAMEGIMIKTLSQKEKALTVLLHVNFFGILLVAIPAVATWRSNELLYNLQFLLLGPIAITAQYFIIRGYRMADISIVGPIDYTWLVFAALIGYLFFGEVPTIEIVLGSSLIAAGGIVLAAVRHD